MQPWKPPGPVKPARGSATAARETADKIEDSIAKSEHGATVSTKVASSLGLIVEKARKVDEIVGEIATASNEQSQGISQINGAIGQMDKVTQGNASTAEETAAAAEELKSQSVSLKETVANLRLFLGGGTRAAAMGAVAGTNRVPAKPAAGAGRTTAGVRHAPPSRAKAPHRSSELSFASSPSES